MTSKFHNHFPIYKLSLGFSFKEETALLPALHPTILSISMHFWIFKLNVLHYHFIMIIINDI